MNSKEMLKLAFKGLDDKKGNNIKIIDISKISVISDYFIIASGSNVNQVQALKDSVEEELGRAGINATHVEGLSSGGWILLDYNDIIVHIFDEDNRFFYDLERIWRDGKEISLDEIENL